MTVLLYSFLILSRAWRWYCFGRSKSVIWIAGWFLT